MVTMKKLDKFTYVSILVLGILAIIAISYFILLCTTSIMNSSEFANILIDLNVYSTFYLITSSISSLFFPVLISIFILIIPYLIMSLLICILFIFKYTKYTGKKRNKIIKTIILSFIILLLLISGFRLFPLTNQYEIKVNSYISQFSNSAVRQFLQDELDSDYYVYRIEIRQGFPDDYNVNIYYRDNITKIERAFLSDSNYEFVENNAKNLTNSLAIKSIILMIFADALYIYFLVYILNEFKRIIQ